MIRPLRPAMDTPAPGPTALRRIAAGPGELTLGVELPLDNDWSSGGRRAAAVAGRAPGVPDLTRHHQLAQLADGLGFAALWLRDVPLWDPSFGDAGQVFDPFPYLGYLAAVTRRIQLGTAAVALPLRHPLHVAKMAATIDRLSQGRLILGIASGDRPIEYPVFGVDHERRAQAVRDGVQIMRRAWAEAGTGGADIQVLPAPANGTIPLVMAGKGQQTLDWLAAGLDGHFTCHRPGHAMRPVAEQWLRACGGAYRPLLTTMLVDLLDDPDAPAEPMRFGARLGRQALIDYLEELRAAHVAHVALNFRPSSRPVQDVLLEIAGHVLPRFPSPSPVAAV
ncbi:TIGR03571 family LLM class oxidoreductase [Nonomuraea sp. NPDC004297]